MVYPHLRCVQPDAVRRYLNFSEERLAVRREHEPGIRNNLIMVANAYPCTMSSRRANCAQCTAYRCRVNSVNPYTLWLAMTNNEGSRRCWRCKNVGGTPVAVIAWTAYAHCSCGVAVLQNGAAEKFCDNFGFCEKRVSIATMQWCWQWLQGTQSLPNDTA